jgi:hypothetical protein
MSPKNVEEKKMTILNQLASQIGQRSEQANHRVAAMILNEPQLMDEIVVGLHSKDAGLLADCAEICTMLAESEPGLVAPYAEQLIPLLQHKKTRVRWEAMHALALITPLVVALINEHFSTIKRLFIEDKSVIVRDYAVVCAGNLAAGGREYAQRVFPFLKESLTAYHTKHAKLGLIGLGQAAPFLKGHTGELIDLANLYLQHVKPSVKQAARQLKKVLEND